MRAELPRRATLCVLLNETGAQSKLHLSFLQGGASTSGFEDITPGVHARCAPALRPRHSKYNNLPGGITELVARSPPMTGEHVLFAVPAPRTNGGASHQSEFARRAARIGLGIHATSQKLAKLAQLAKRTSMFDDPAAEINDLTGELLVVFDVCLMWLHFICGVLQSMCFFPRYVQES